EATAEETPAEEAAAEPAGAPEQKIDVLAEFSAAEPTVAAEPDEDEEDAEEAAETEEVRLPATALLFQAPEPRTRRRVRADAGPPRSRTAPAAAEEPAAATAPETGASEAAAVEDA